VKHRASHKFWVHYQSLPEPIRNLADKNFALLKSNSGHPSLRFKKVGGLWSVRVGDHYRALARRRGEDVYWIWIGPHSEYDKLLSP
jgi:hypothetical protein